MKLPNRAARWGSGWPSRRRWNHLSKTQRLTAQGAMVLGALVLTAALLGAANGVVHIGDQPYAGTASLRGLLAKARVADSAQAELDVVREELARARTLIDFSTRYNVAADLAALIYDLGNQEQIDPELAFRLVWVESRFNPRAVSSAGALGLSQVMPATAKYYDPDITPEQLFDRETNLRIGFRFLSDLLEQYHGDLPMALLAYNRGPSKLRELLAGGVDPRNGYASSVLDGYTGAGIP